jgi:hypothetical protein
VIHALVSQEARGEVAAIDIRNNIILDSQRVVPGYTFEPVGELPSALAVPREDPTFTFVANFGQLDIFARATRRFMPEDRRGGDLGSIPQTFTCRVDNPVADLILSPDETLLYATLPEKGSILEIPLTPWDPDVRQSPFGDDNCSVQREIPLSAMIPPANEAMPRADHCLSCPHTVDDSDPPVVTSTCTELVEAFPTDSAGNPLPFPPRDPPRSIGPDPRPLRLSLDEDNGLLLVADERLPLVHVLDVTTAGGATPLEPLNVGVPVQQVVVTPAVPFAPEADSAVATERFMYGIDGIDRSVFAADYVVDATTRQPAVALLPVNTRAEEPRDRMQLGAGARTLEVITTDEYQVDETTGEIIAPPCDMRDGASNVLEGVFLGIAGNDGNVYIVDVYDLDAPCRLGDPDICEGADPGIVRRHRVRVLDAEPGGIKATSAPAFVISTGATVTVESDGTTVADPSPRVVPFVDEEGMNLDCPAGQSDLTSGDRLVCGLVDPWAAIPESWVATWEGGIPGTRGGRGRFGLDGDQVVFDAEVQFCARGVLGGDDVAELAPDEPEAGYAGDLLVVTGEVPYRPDGDPLAECCTTLFGGEDPLIQLIDPTIQHASQDRLIIDTPRLDLDLPRSCGDQGLTDPFGALTACYDELVTYEIRTRDSYAVQGTTTGFRHRVVEDVDGSCMVDVTLDPRRQGRAFNGRLYDNGNVSFTLQSATGVPYPARGDELIFSFVVGDSPSRLVRQGGTLLNDLRFNRADQSLYSVDIGGFRGLTRFTTDPFEAERSFE